MQELFILSPPRSFTSVTCAMLGCHPDMFGCAETNLFVAETLEKLFRSHRMRRNRMHGLLRTLAELAFNAQREEDIGAVREWLRENAEMTTSELFRLMGEWAGGRTLVEKSPLHVYFPGALERMKANFPDAYYLHLTRHPASVCDSVSRVREEITQKVGGAKARPKMLELIMVNGGEDLSPDTVWLEPHMKILEFLEGVPQDRQMRLRGEDLLADPKTYLPQVCEWLGKRTDQASVEAMIHPEHSPFACYGPPSARLGNDSNFFENPALKPFSAKPIPLGGGNADHASIAFSETLKDYAVQLGY